MSIEINRVRVEGDGRVRCEVEFPDLDSFSRETRKLLEHQLHEFASIEDARQYAQKVAAAEAATGRRIPRTIMAYVPGNAYPPDEPEGLTAGTAVGGFMSPDFNPGGTD